MVKKLNIKNRHYYGFVLRIWQISYDHHRGAEKQRIKPQRRGEDPGSAKNADAKNPCVLSA